MADSKLARLQGWGITILRLIIGALFLMSGVQKLSTGGLDSASGVLDQLGIPLPLAVTIVASTVEVICGVALVFGLCTRWASTPLAIGMLVDFLLIHPPSNFFVQHTESEYTLLRLSASVALVLIGPGKLALDNVRAFRK